MNHSGIYKIQSICKPERCYIGSAKNISKRKTLHISKLNLNKHHSIKLQNHVNKYGINDLVFSTLIECEIQNLIKEEQIYIDNIKPFFNICKIAGSSLGIKRSEETNLKHSLATKGKKYGPQSEEIKERNKNKRGHAMSESVRLKISNTMKGVKHTEERCRNMSKALIGKAPTRGNTGMKHTEEHKNKISEGMKRNHELRKLNIKRYA